MKKLSLLVVLFMCFTWNQSYAQFEGKIEFQDYEIKSGKKVKDDDSFVMYITPDRILLQGDKGYKVGNALETEGLLIRQKEKDFVFLTGENQAMSITKEGITSFMNMFGSDAKDDVHKAESNLQIKNTGETKSVHGYETEKFILKDKEHPEKRSEVWMTQGLDINWGILSESWDTNMAGFTGDDLPFDLILKDGYFPLRWEQYEGDTLTDIVETEVTSTDLARSKVELASGVKVVSLQQYIFNKMRQEQ